MTVGEKIQYYRKKIGLSQEELGQKMLVSRQTVSLWEMDKTLPTVDNLIRLKEFFSVSVDDLLSDTEPTMEIPTEPKETYIFQYEKKDLQQIFKKERFRFIRGQIISTLASIVLFLFFVSTDAPEIMIGMLLGYVLANTLFSIRGFFAYKKARKNTENRILKNTYSYELFRDYFIVNISRKGEVINTDKIHYDDITKIEIIENYFLIHVERQCYIMKKDYLDPESALMTIYKNSPNKVEEKQPWDKFRTVSLLLFLLSIGTIGGAMLVVFILTGLNKAITENMWAFFLFLPIPIASILYGFYLKKKGYKYKKNIIVGFIMAIVLCIYGSFTFLFGNVYSHSDAPIEKAEYLLQIDIPPHSLINTQDWTVGTQNVPRSYIYSTTDIYFEDVDVKEFEEKLESNDKWLSSIPAGIVGITSDFCETHTSDYYIIYNKDTGEFNKLPPENGTYDFINVLYNAENNTMKLVEYQIEYAE